MAWLTIGDSDMALHVSTWAQTVLVGLVAIAGQPLEANQTDTPPSSQCVMALQASDQSWRGGCGPVFGNKETATLTARKVTSLPGGKGRGDATSTLMLVGELPTQWGRWDLEFEFYGKDGVLRTPGGWRPITLIDESATTLRFRVREDVEVAPSDLDRRIVERATAILTTEAVWDRADDRQCSADDKTWSIYCALHRATLEVSGGFHHRRPCLQIVRTILYERVAEERKKGRKYPHILADYNNDTTTRLADLHSVLKETAARIKVR